MAAAAALVVIFVAVLSLPLRTAGELGLTDGEATGWIMALYGIPGALTVWLALRYRQPLLLTGNIFILVFIATLGTEISWPDLVGASMFAGAIVLVLGLLGVVDRLSWWVPGSIVFGLLAGAVLHFFVDLFTAVGDEPLLVGGTLIAYLLARRFLEPGIPALLPALVVGLALAAATGDLGTAPADVELVPSFTSPTLSWRSVVTVTPVMIVLITVQANVPSLVFLRQQGYSPPDAVLNGLSGGGTVGGSALGPVGVSLSLPATALCAGPEAGEREDRYASAIVAGTASLVIGLLAGFATAVAQTVPPTLLVAFVGLAVIGVLAAALRQMTEGPLRLGPLFAFGIALSDIELLELGSFFWGLVGGLAVSLLLEREAWGNLPSRH
jgi:benzoate membrane transport protein